MVHLSSDQVQHTWASVATWILAVHMTVGCEQVTQKPILHAKVLLYTQHRVKHKGIDLAKVQLGLKCSPDIR